MPTPTPISLNVSPLRPLAMSRKPRAVIIAMAAGLALTSAAFAQLREDPGLQQAPPDPEFTLPTPIPVARPEPMRPNAAVGATTDVENAPWGALLSEGTFITGARGKPVRGKSGTWYLIFDARERGPAGQSLPPMVLLSNLNLAAMERLAPRMQEGENIIVSGQVFLYAGLNYLLPTTPPIVEQAAAAPAQSTTPATTTPAAKPEGTAETKPATEGAGEKTAPSNEPSIEQIIEQLDRAVGSSRRVDLPKMLSHESGVDASDALGAGGASAPSVPGGFLTSRKGRVVRDNDGQTVFVFDSGASIGSSREGPMVLLPCLNLMRMEYTAATQGEKATYTVSGDVFVYRGNNYLLPRMFVVNRRTDVVVSGQ